MKPRVNQFTGVLTLAAGLALGLSAGCATSIKSASIATDHPLKDYREAYGVYPGMAGNGVSKHLVRSHTTAIIVRPVSSLFELGSRLWDRIWDIGRRLEVRLVRSPMLRNSGIADLPLHPGGMDLIEWEARLDKLTGRPSCTADIEFIIGGERFYTLLEQAIESANTSIDLQVYLFDNDDVAGAVADRLRSRSAQVEVRVIYDGLGTYLSHMATAPTQPEDTEFIQNMPRYLCKGSDVRLRVIPNIWLSGNHVKSMIFDQRVAFVGGMNIGREYRYEWHDMMIRLEGDAVGHLSENFQSTWRHNSWGGDFAMAVPKSSRPPVDRKPGSIPVRFLYTYPAKAQIYRAQLEAIRRAQAYIYIENAYFADDRILYELCRARRRGVDVRVIMPAVVNHKVMERSNRVAINTLLNHGARVYMYPGMSHIKAAVYDGWACLGTANFDKLSLQINRELNLATSHPDTVRQLLDELFEPDFRKSVEITEPVSLDLQDHLIELIADET
jgi:cardiolipin synthase